VQWGDDWFGACADRIASVEREVTEGKKVIENLRKQTEELQRATSERALENKEIAKRNALQDKSDDYLKGLREEVALLRVSKEEQSGILAARTAVGELAQNEARALLIEKDKIAKQEEEKKNAEALVKSSADYVKSLREQVALLSATDATRAGVEAGQNTLGGDTAIATQLLKEKKDLADKEATTKRLTDLKQNELNKLEEERILLQQGAEAAQAFRLAKQGLSEADAKSIARQQAELDKLKESKKPGAVVKQDIPELKAFESRVLTRGGSGEDPSKITARGMTEAVKELQALNKKLMEQRKDQLTLKVVKR